MLPLTLEGKFEIPTLPDQEKAVVRALDDTQEAVTKLRSVAFDRGPDYLSFRLSSLAQLWRRTAPAPGKYTLRIASEGESLFALYELRSPEMVLMSVALSVLPFFFQIGFSGPFRGLRFLWLAVVWIVHTVNLLLARRWFRGVVQGVLCDPLRVRFH